MPSCAELYKDGHVVKSSSYATIYINIDRMCIQTVYGSAYAGVYTITTRNSLGEGHISFELKVKGKQMHAKSSYQFNFISEQLLLDIVNMMTIMIAVIPLNGKAEFASTSSETLHF